MTGKTFAGELSDDQSDYVREYLTDCICDDMEDAVDFLGGRCDIEIEVSEKVDSKTDSEVAVLVEQYSSCTVEDILDID